MDTNQTTPLANYAKSPMMNTSMPSPSQPTGTAPGNKDAKKSNKKTIMAVVGLAFLALVVLVAILIVQRQATQKGPQAPSAPSSKPSAATAPANNCTLSFDVPMPGVTPSPSPTPAISPSPTPTATPTVACLSKSTYQDEPGNATDTNGDGILDYKLLTKKTQFGVGDVIVFGVDADANISAGIVTVPTVVYDQFGSDMMNYLTFKDSNCGAGAYNSQTGLLTCNFNMIAGGDAPEKLNEVVFRMTVKTAPSTTVGITNTANVYIQDKVPGCIGNTCTGTSTCGTKFELLPPVGGPSPTPTIVPSPTPTIVPSPTPTVVPTPTPTVVPTPTPGVTPSPSPTYACNSTCSTDAQCQTVNAAYVCDAETSRCRLDSNKSDISCQPKANTYTCNSTCETTAQCQTANSGYVCDTSSGRCRMASYPSQTNCLAPTYSPAPPTVGCNEICSTNADCSNSNHICYTTSDGSNRCRLESYPNSSNCSVPPVYAPAATPTTVAQPTLPEELPSTGFADTVANWLKVGLAALGVGMALLLLL